MKFYKDRFKRLREHRQMTQVEVANALGITKQTVSNWENDGLRYRPSRKRVYDIARVLGCSVQEFCDAPLSEDCLKIIDPPNGPSPAKNTDLENFLLKLYRDMDLARQIELLQIAERVSRGQRSNHGRGSVSKKETEDEDSHGGLMSQQTG